MNITDFTTPEGTRDTLPDVCDRLSTLQNKLASFAAERGYGEIKTPGLEFYDLFCGKSKLFQQESLYKLTDSRGRLLVLRPDSTLPVARAVCSRLGSFKFPLKLFYRQTIYRANPKMSGRDDEIRQFGIEIIGEDRGKGDRLSLEAAFRMLDITGISDFRVEIGDNTFFLFLTNKLNLSDDDTANLAALIEQKNYKEVSDFLSPFSENQYARALVQLPRLFGGVSVFHSAKSAFVGCGLDPKLSEFSKLFAEMSKVYGDRVTADFGMTSRHGFYTGTVFRAYAAGHGKPVLSGGRYDTLYTEFGADLSAVGFALNIDAVGEILDR
ncbi:MAG: ATP phosphoribosyltransferase regulatory subunit [Oscillospiraceae bacterium]|jgi:ATP phosphoribosyltransferase regulatory subunit|nr:ATP phosphoribosyltransferase regulatory subunit [Oscillospiraceae bacterium]